MTWKQRCEAQEALIDQMNRALKQYLAAQPQCSCNEFSACQMAEARNAARAAIAKAEEAAE